jgi:hypothetical protein
VTATSDFARSIRIHMCGWKLSAFSNNRLSTASRAFWMSSENKRLSGN